MFALLDTESFSMLDLLLYSNIYRHLHLPHQGEPQSIFNGCWDQEILIKMDKA